jgi:DNA processing protein
VAVLAQGLHKIYPKENAYLADRIVDEGGILMSEYSYASSTFPSNFVDRDRIQAGLSRGVVMVQSDESGGSWHASRAALRYGRYLIVPCPTEVDINSGHPKVRGNLRVLHSSATERAEFLKCSVEDLEHFKILQSREDYPALESVLLASAA